MSKLELLLKKAGIPMERSGQRHKYYIIDGKRYTLSHGSHGDDRGRHRKLLRMLRERIKEG